MASPTANKLPLRIGEDSTGAPVGHDPKNPKRDEKLTRMGTASIPRLITEFAIPSIAGMLVNGAYNIIASIFLGQAMGEIGLSAMTVANPIMIVFIAIAMLVGVGGNALAALRLGEGKRVDAEISLGNTVTLSVFASIAIIVCATMPFILDNLLTLSSATDEVRPYAASFIRIISFGFILQCIGLGVNNFIRTAGAPNRALVTMVLGALTCIICSYLFVIQFNWGVSGSAWAIVCGQAVSCAAVLWYFIFTKNVPLRLHLRYMRPQAKIMKMILSLGLASFFVQAGLAVVSFVLNYFLVVYGAQSPLGADEALASFGVVQRIAMFCLLPVLGVAVAIQPLIGFNYGARLIERVRKTFWYGVAGSIVLGIFMWGLVHLFPSMIVGAFGIEHEEVANFTVFALKVQLFLMPLIGFQVIGSNYFQATGQPLKSILLTLTRQIIFLVPLLMILPEVLPRVLPQFNSLEALCFGAPIADFLSIFTTGVFVLLEMKRLGKLERGEVKAKYLSADAG
ncbi:MAG: MATE family efflux transporter [Eggerthellaceae bacterium]|jgi:putative MATE family efflux protein|nr:MATE family efflux transporter [Eggerthellaceae bacterium]MDR2721773.1 MATE family efflux transporter [Coriobacteriaceae bacterium]